MSLNKTELFIWFYLGTKHSLRNYNDGNVQKYTRESLLIISFLPRLRFLLIFSQKNQFPETDWLSQNSVYTTRLAYLFHDSMFYVILKTQLRAVSQKFPYLLISLNTKERLGGGMRETYFYQLNAQRLLTPCLHFSILSGNYFLCSQIVSNHEIYLKQRQ